MKKNYILVLITFLIISCDTKPTFSDEEKNQTHFFIESIDANNESVQISNSGNAYDKVSDKDIDNMLELKSKALSLAEQIPDSVLIKMNPNLPIEFAKYKKGLSLRILNLKSGNQSAEIEGSKLLDEWGDWYDSNIKKIKVPKLK